MPVEAADKRAGRRATSRTVAPRTWCKGARVAVRMYRGFLGDCFLLRFKAEKRDAFMLIDCGAFLGSPDERARMRTVAENIKAVSGGHLEVVVVTHEHWDHLCGFHHAADVFDSIKIDELWLGWTEDPADAAATALRKRRAAALAALQAAATRMAAAGASAASRDTVETVLGFAGVAAAGRATTGDILAAMKRKAGTVRYLSPGCEPLNVAQLAETRIHVLGPPRDRALLTRSDPTRKGREVYDLAGAADGDRAFLAAGLSAPGDPDAEGAMPFDRKHRHPIAALAALSPNAASWLADLAAAYAEPEASWRRVDGDWLGAVESLALKLDHDTNNTSLALAIELSPGRDTLLFPGDAQVGNWLSWADYRHPSGDEQPTPSTTTRDSLLARTVLYKVGHHGSHNATLRAEGLEKMTSRDLVALIPVDEDFARNTKRWNMPFPSLDRRLAELTGGNVLRADRSAAEMKNKKAAMEHARPNVIFDTAVDSASPDEFVEIYI